jgi:hypothetical protein
MYINCGRLANCICAGEADDRTDRAKCLSFQQVPAAGRGMTG